MPQDTKTNINQITSSITDTTPDGAGILNNQFFSTVYRLAMHGRLWSAVALLAVGAGGSYFMPSTNVPFAGSVPFLSAIFLGQEPNLFPQKMTLYTYDSSAPEGERIQHKEIMIAGNNRFTGTYRYRESAGHGTITGFRRIGGGTIELAYGSEDPNGDGLGSITLRQLRYASENDATVWVGFETGHDCSCGIGMAHEGPFTSIPAVLTSSAEPPEVIKAIINAELMNAEPFKWPADIQKDLQQKQAAQKQAAK